MLFAGSSTFTVANRIDARLAEFIVTVDGEYVLVLSSQSVGLNGVHRKIHATGTLEKGARIWAGLALVVIGVLVSLIAIAPRDG